MSPPTPPISPSDMDNNSKFTKSSPPVPFRASIPSPPSPLPTDRTLDLPSLKPARQVPSAPPQSTQDLDFLSVFTYALPSLHSTPHPHTFVLKNIFPKRHRHAVSVPRFSFPANIAVVKRRERPVSSPARFDVPAPKRRKVLSIYTSTPLSRSSVIVPVRKISVYSDDYNDKCDAGTESVYNDDLGIGRKYLFRQTSGRGTTTGKGGSGGRGSVMKTGVSMVTTVVAELDISSFRREEEEEIEMEISVEEDGGDAGVYGGWDLGKD